MKAKPSSVSTAKKGKGATSGVTAIFTTEKSGVRRTHTSASRSEIRETTHRVMGSRQSQRPVDRSGQPRKKRG